MSRINYTFSNNAIAEAIRLPNQFELADWFKEKTSSQNFVAFSLVAMLHLTALFGLLYQFKNNSAQPVLSFTVTMMDISATSSNVVASAASTASHSTSKATSKVEENTNALAAAAKAAEQGSLEKKSKAAQSHDSVQQTAVVAPTTPAVFDAAYLNNPAPSYPALSRHLQEQGTVSLNVFVGTDGKAQNVQIAKSSGFDRLDSAALSTVKKWRFVSAKKGGELVASWVQVPVSFVLEK